MKKKNNQQNEEKMLTTKQAAELADVGKQTIRNWIKSFHDPDNGIYVGIKKGGRWQIYQDGLKKIISGMLNYDNKKEIAKKNKKGNGRRSSKRK